jgi:hypothetical protein
VWKRSASFWAFSLGLIIPLLPGCGGNDELLYQPAEISLTIRPARPSQYDLAPTLSDDASVLAWVRIGGNGPQDPYLARVLLRRRATGVTDTLVALTRYIEALDISPDGRRLVGVVPFGSDSTVLYLWGDDGGEESRRFPRDFIAARTPRWDGGSSVIFGADGPNGGGVYRWDLTSDRITPISVRFTDSLEGWSGRSPGIDRSGGLICMERRTERYTFQAMVRTLGGTDQLVHAATGGSPHFWQVLPDEPDGLTYIDQHANLWALRLATGDLYPVLGGVYDYDVSPDGRWIFARASIPPVGPALYLRDLRDLR